MSLRRLRRNWNAFAETDPLWSILTWSDKRGNRWSRDEFFATGVAEIEEVLRRARECCPGLATRRALDFGCGVGRLTQALAREFDEAHGVDVAETMIQRAHEFDAGGSAIYHVNELPDLALFPDAHFDFVYSSITLQHMEPALMKGYLREFGRVLRPSGLAVFQVPERPRRDPNPNRLVHAVGAFGARLSRRVRGVFSRQPVMDMHGLAKEEVHTALRAGGCEVVRIDESTLAGVDWFSWMYFARCAR